MSAVIIDITAARLEREAPPSRLVIVRDESPDNPNVSYYSIMGTSFAVVQNQINYLIAQVESFGRGGFGTFNGPRRDTDGNFYARGRVEVAPDV
jgi:hypothetical protein